VCVYTCASNGTGTRVDVVVLRGSCLCHTGLAVFDDCILFQQSFAQPFKGGACVDQLVLLGKEIV
jgi:hypothetical protein